MERQIVFIAACVVGIILLVLFWRGQQIVPQFSFGCPVGWYEKTAVGTAQTKNSAVNACTADYFNLITQLSGSCDRWCARYNCQAQPSVLTENMCAENAMITGALWQATSTIHLDCGCDRYPPGNADNRPGLA